MDSGFVSEVSFDLTPAQAAIVEATDGRIAVEASAASAKTTVLTERVRRLIRRGANPKGIVVITYTRMAAAELIGRLGKDFKSEMFIGTVHGFAARLLSLSGHGDLVGEAAEKEDFDKLFIACRNFCSGFVSQFHTVFLDEAQDSTESQLRFIFDFLKPVNFFVVYDEKQTLFEFAGASPETLRHFLSREKAIYYPLNENFRNGSAILRFAKRIIAKDGYIDHSIATAPFLGKVINEPWDEAMLDTYVAAMRPYRDWAILCRTNADIAYIGELLDKKGIPYCTFKQSEITKEQMDILMKDDKVKLLTIHSAKGTQYNNVLVYRPTWYGDDSVKVNYVAATRAKRLLIWARPVRGCKKKESEYNF